jgi:hypothetical protein
MQLAERPGEAFLNQIVGGNNIAGQRPGITPKARNMYRYLLSNVGHARLPPLAAAGAKVK